MTQEAYRRFIEDNYSLEKQIDLIENLLNEIPTKENCEYIFI